jgi:hypothetical protein
MNSWTPLPPNDTSTSFLRRILGFAALLGALAAGLQNFNTLRDFAEKVWEQVQIAIFSNSALDRVYREYNAQTTALCASAKYVDLFKVSPCILDHFTEQQKNDPSQPTPPITTQLLDFSAERTAINNLLISGYQKYGTSEERDYGSVTAKNEIARTKAVRDLIDKRITIGQYNSQLWSIYQEDKKRMNLLKMKYQGP